MTDHTTRLEFTLSNALINRLDTHAQRKGQSRDEVVHEALCLYLTAQHKLMTREQLQKGYEAMAGINRAWAQQGMRSELRILDAYEALLSECEKHE